jgi:hypothetical protein
MLDECREKNLIGRAVRVGGNGEDDVLVGIDLPWRQRPVRVAELPAERLDGCLGRLSVGGEVIPIKAAVDKLQLERRSH